MVTKIFVILLIFSISLYFFGNLIFAFIKFGGEILSNVANNEYLIAFLSNQKYLNIFLFANSIILIGLFLYFIYFFVSNIRQRALSYYYEKESVSNPIPVKNLTILLLLILVQLVLVLQLVISPFSKYTINLNALGISNFITNFPISFIFLVDIGISIFLIIYTYKNIIQKWMKGEAIFEINDDKISLSMIDHVVNTSDPILRNLKITQAYHDLCVGFAFLLGNKNANWSNFACWASKTAGKSIRKDDLPKIIQKLFVDRLRMKKLFDDFSTEFNEQMDEKEIIWNMYILGVIEEISDSIAKGNLKVFEEVSPFFSKFIFIFQGDKEFDKEKLDVFNTQFAEGHTLNGGQDLLKEALTHYYHSMFSNSDKEKAELILMGNIKIGLHEQMRLQSHIEQAVTAPSRHGFELAIQSKFETILPKFILKSRVQDFLSSLKDEIPILCKEIITTIMKLTLPTKKVKLSSDAPRSSLFQMFPSNLKQIENPELKDILEKYDKNVNSISGSGATDWVDLDDRLNYIIDLFRANQQKDELFYPPFNKIQTNTIYDGKIPSGSL